MSTPSKFARDAADEICALVSGRIDGALAFAATHGVTVQSTPPEDIAAIIDRHIAPAIEEVQTHLREACALIRNGMAIRAHEMSIGYDADHWKRLEFLGLHAPELLPDDIRAQLTGEPK